MAAVTSAVNLIKKAASTVDDVRSLGPLLGRYFDAKNTAVKAVKENKKAGGSNMAKAIEIELALKQQADFERELQMLFMQTGNIDVWDAIQRRVQEMNREDMYAEKAQKEAAARKQKEFEDMLLMIAVVFGAMVFIGGLLFVATQMAQ
jgi:ActR/RegA family two-component response regulator